MKLSALQKQRQRCKSTRKTNTFRPLATALEAAFKTHGDLFWLFLHALCCLLSLLWGFRFSRLLFFILLFPAPGLRAPTKPQQLRNRPSGHVFVGRHDILIRSWPYPNATELVKGQRLMEAVQIEQRLQFGIGNPRTIIAVTPTFVRTSQTLHLTALAHSLMLVPYDLVWIVVEAGGVSNDTASLLARSGLRTIHVGFDEQMPTAWADRHQMEARMRIRALRTVREKSLDGIVIFADDSNIHSTELFDEVQSVKWIGAVSMGILAHSGHSDLPSKKMKGKKKVNVEKIPVPVQGPVCNSSGQLSGWNTFNSWSHEEKSTTHIDDRATVLPRKLEWAGFVLNSRLVWKKAKGKPNWVKDLDSLDEKGDKVENILSLLKDASFVEPLGKCGRKLLLWWLRVEARADSKFPPRWSMDTPLEVTVSSKSRPSIVPAKGTPHASTEFSITEETTITGERKHPQKHRNSRSRHGSRRRKP